MYGTYREVEAIFVNGAHGLSVTVNQRLVIRRIINGHGRRHRLPQEELQTGGKKGRKSGENGGIVQRIEMSSTASIEKFEKCNCHEVKEKIVTFLLHSSPSFKYLKRVKLPGGTFEPSEQRDNA